MMRAEETDLKKIRRACGNSLWTAAAVLCKDGLWNLTVLLVELCRPFYSAHSLHVGMLKSSEATVEWYARQARGDWVETLVEACDVCNSPTTLAKMGFDTTFSTLAASSSDDDPERVEQDPWPSRT